MATITACASTLSVANLDDVYDWGWDALRLAEEVNAFRLRTIPNLPADCQPRPALWAELYAEFPDTWRMLITGPEQIVGFWQFLPLTSQGRAMFLNGKTLIHKPLAEVFQPLDQPGWYDINLYTVSIDSRYRNTFTGMLLVNSLLNVVTDLAHRGILIRELFAGILTREGMILNHGLGLDIAYVTDHEVRGKVYAGHVPTILQRRIAQDSPDEKLKVLCELYAAQENELSWHGQILRAAG